MDKVLTRKKIPFLGYLNVLISPILTPGSKANAEHFRFSDRMTVFSRAIWVITDYVESSCEINMFQFSKHQFIIY